MSLNEIQAQRVMLVRAIEQARDAADYWSASDAKEATRATIEIVGAKASFEQFVARRAEWILNEITKRKSEPAIDLSPRRLPTIAGWVLIACALTIGFVTDHLVSDRRVNIVEYPLIGLILWNLGIFVAILADGIGNLFSSHGKSGGILTDMMGRWQMWGAIKTTAGTQASWIGRFNSDWCSISASLNRHRLAFVLHTASMSFALGALGSLYARGLVKEYRAGWESTWCTSADCVHAIATVVLTPGALLWNMQIPDVDHIASLRFPGSAGEIASDWIHLYAGSILVLIIIPRLLLACVSGISKWRLQRSFPMPIRNAYFATLRAIRGGDPIDVLVIPFRYELKPQVINDLTRLLERVHGIAVTISVQAPIIMGEDTQDWKEALGKERHIAVFVIFNIAATAELDTHGQLLKRIQNDVHGRVPVIPIIDTGAYADRDKDRFSQRCKQWRTVLDHVRCKPLFLNLTTPDAEDIQKSLEDRFSENG